MFKFINFLFLKVEQQDGWSSSMDSADEHSSSAHNLSGGHNLNSSSGLSSTPPILRRRSRKREAADDHEVGRLQFLVASNIAEQHF